MRFSIRNKIIAYVAVPVAIILIGAMVWSIAYVHQRVRENIRADLAAEAEGYAAEFEMFIGKASRIAETTAGFLSIAPDLSEEQLYALLRENVRRNARVYGAAIAFEPGTFHPGDELFCPYVYRQGDGLAEMNIDRSVLDWYRDPRWQWWHRPKNSGRGEWTDPYFDEGAGNILMVTFSAPFFRDGQFRGVATIDISLPDLRETVGERLFGGRDFAILTHDGRFVYSPDPAEIMATSVIDEFRAAGRADLLPVVDRILNQPHGTETITGLLGDEPEIIAYADIPTTGWTLLTYTPESEAYSVFRETVAWVVVPFLATLLLIFGSIVLVARNLAQPIRALRDHALAVAAGDLRAAPRPAASPANDEIGDLTQAFATMQKQVADRENRLRNAREITLTQLLESAPDGMLVVDRDGCIRRCNASAERMFGYRIGSDELRLGKTRLHQLLDTNSDSHPPDLDRWIADPDHIPAFASISLTGRRTDGTTFPIDATLNRFEEPDETRTVIALRDVTERQQAQEAIARALEEAEFANQAKSQFLASMSHELRTPLNGVLGYAQILQRDPAATPRQKEQLKAIISCGDHLLNLINDVLDLARIEAGRIEVDDTPTDLHHLLKSVADINAQRAHSKGLEFTTDVSPEVPRAIRTDERKLRQILVNLLGNAVKFTERGAVTLRVAEHPRGSLRFEVTDTGPGIAPAQLEEIFDPFKQLEAGKAAGGTGLGLAISRHLAESLGGALTVSSTPGSGSQFALTIPLNEIPAAEVGAVSTIDESADPTIRVAPGKTVTVLVADDRPTNRDILATLLGNAGFTVVQADDGDTAVEQARATRPDLILLDIRMPRLNGIEALKLIRADEQLADTRVVAVTASVFPEFRDNAIRAGFDDFLGKPFRAPALFRLLEKHLDPKKIVREAVTSTGEEADATPDLPTPSAAEALPAELQKELAQAVRIRNLTAINKIARKLANIPDFSEFAEQIATFARRFDFKSLQQLIASRGSDPSAPENNQHP